MPLTLKELDDLHQILTDVVLSAPDGADLSKEARLLGRILQAKVDLKDEQAHLESAFDRMDRDQADLLGAREMDNAQEGGA